MFRFSFKAEGQVVKIVLIVDKGGFFEEDGIFLRFVEIEAVDDVLDGVDYLIVAGVEDEFGEDVVREFDYFFVAFPQKVDGVFLIVFVVFAEQHPLT